MNRSSGDMFSFVTHTWNPLNGECPHKCSYCYAMDTPAGRQGYYSGPLRLNERAMSEPLGKDRAIFVCSLNDLFAANVPGLVIQSVLDRVRVDGPKNTYLFQTKNPDGYREWLDWFPPICILGCTIETTDSRLIQHVSPVVPWPERRMLAMEDLKGVRKAVTIEPILDFHLGTMVDWLARIAPEWVAIGADSKKHGLSEPSAGKILELIAELGKLHIEVRQKANLKRLLGDNA